MSSDRPHAAIVGGGVAGLGIAWRLAQAGWRVDLFEPGRPGRSATWASAGMLAATAECAGLPEVVRTFAFAALQAWPRFIEEIATASGVALGLTGDGILIVPQDGDDAARLGHEMHDVVRVGGHAEWLTPQAVRQLEPALREAPDGALLLPDDRAVDNRLLGDTLRAACRNADVALHTMRVLRVLTTSGRASGVETAQGSFGADVVVVAAGAWSGEGGLMPEGAALPVVPVKGQMIACAMTATPLRNIVWGEGVYTVPRGGALVVGATVEDAGFDERLDKTVRDEFAAAAKRLASKSVTGQVVEMWCGFRPNTPDGMPILGKTAVEGLFVATGQFRNGILFAPLVADLVAKAVLTGASDSLIAPFAWPRSY